MKAKNPFFEPGSQHQNRKGIYTVLSVQADKMLVMYQSNNKVVWVNNLELQERIVKRFAAELEKQEQIEAVLTEAEQTKSGQYAVYVILLDSEAGQSKLVTYAGKANQPCVYVGQTGKAIDERFIDHLTGHNSRIAKFVKQLLPELFEKYNPLATRGQALKVEAALAEKLAQEGYTVLGGH